MLSELRTTRRFEDGHLLMDNMNGIRLVIHKDCMVFGAMTNEGLNALAFLCEAQGFQNNPNVTIYKLDDGTIHTVEIYYNNKITQQINE